MPSDTLRPALPYLDSPDPQQAALAVVRRSILVGERDGSVAKVLADALTSDYEIVSASSGTGLQETVVARLPELVLLDADLADIDGFELCRTLKADPLTTDIPVILMGDPEAEEDEIRGLELGAIDFLLRPLRPTVLVQRVSNHLALKRSRDMLANQALIDHVTGIGNRRHFEENFSREWNRAMRLKASISVLLLDLDRFSAYTQHYGQEGADEALALVARLLKAMLERSADSVSRYGGKRFAAILPQTEAEGAMFVAERLRSGIEQAALPHDAAAGQPLITLSVGAASTVPTAAQDPVDLLRAADTCLAEAKAQGRNRVVN